MILSKKQINLFNDIISPNIPNISVLGSTQSGKTYDICGALIQYANRLREYEKEQRKDPNYVSREYNGAIIGWTTDTIKSNIVDNLVNILEKEYHFTNGKQYVLKYGNQDKYLEIYGIKFYFFGFNTNLSFNRILGKPCKTKGRNQDSVWITTQFRRHEKSTNRLYRIFYKPLKVGYGYSDRNGRRKAHHGRSA